VPNYTLGVEAFRVPPGLAIAPPMAFARAFYK